MSYGYEDIDYKVKGDASTGYAYNAAESTFFCRIRDLFVDELRSMYVNRESAGCWSAENLIKQFDEFQSEFPEELWRVDIERKYLRSYREGSPRFLNEMANGKKKYQRRQFERNQEKYMASKFFGNVAVADQIMFRCNTPTNSDLVIQPNYTLHLTPYSDMYLDVMFGATYRTQVRAEAGQQYDIECPFTTMDDTAVLIYCASMIQSMGDVSACYIHDNDFSKATRLKELIIGNATRGYENNFLTNLGIGNNALLEKLDIQNTPNLAQSLNLSGCGNLKELYAKGSGLTGVTFADGGSIETAELPAINTMIMRHLNKLNNLNIASLDKLATLIAESCTTVDVRQMVNNSPNLSRIRITGIEWNEPNTDLLDRLYKMYGIDRNGYNLPQSVLAGSVHVPIIKQQKLYEYQTAWNDLELSSDTIVEQFKVTFLNYDGSVLDIQYVDKGESGVDPTTRLDNPITPVKPSTVEHDFTFAGWEGTYTNVFGDRTVTATYTSTVRQYTIKYVSKGTVLQESRGNYGQTIQYTGETPVYTGEESGYVYYLFNRWDKSGFINGDKTVEAVFDRFEYREGAFNGKQMSELTPVEFYALTKLGTDLISELFEAKDSMTITVGNDLDFDDIESVNIVSEPIVFNGRTSINTGVKLFDADKDFVIAFDYEFDAGSANGEVLAHCFDGYNNEGIQLYCYSSSTESLGSKVRWNAGDSEILSRVGRREMVVIRHRKGDNNLYVYNGNMTGTTPLKLEISGNRQPSMSDTLVLGNDPDGSSRTYAHGTIYWAKVWFADFDDATCNSLAMWTHEEVEMEFYDTRRYYLSDGSRAKTSMSFIAKNALRSLRGWNNVQSNAGGWANSELNRILNARLYNAIPLQVRSLIKQVRVASNIGNLSSELSNSDCYIHIPSISELDPSVNNEPYRSEGEIIPFFTNNESRIKSTSANESPVEYWTRSPNMGFGSSYIWIIQQSGSSSEYGTIVTYNDSGLRGVVIQFSF